MGQQWILSDKNFLSIHTIGSFGGDPILLLSGFAEPKSDLAYLCAYLGKALAEEGYYVNLVDLTGSGNSYGALSDITLNTLGTDIYNAVAYINDLTQKKTIVIARGLSAALTLKFCNANMVKWCIGINPFYIKNYGIQSHQIPKIFRISEDSEDEMLKAVLRFMGTELTNIDSQMLNGEFIFSILNSDWKSVYKNTDIDLICFQFYETDIIEKEVDIELEDGLIYYQENSFPNDSEKISKLICKVKDKLRIISKKE